MAGAWWQSILQTSWQRTAIHEPNAYSKLRKLRSCKAANVVRKTVAPLRPKARVQTVTWLVLHPPAGSLQQVYASSHRFPYRSPMLRPCVLLGHRAHVWPVVNWAMSEAVAPRSKTLPARSGQGVWQHLGPTSQGDNTKESIFKYFLNVRSFLNTN